MPVRLLVLAAVLGSLVLAAPAAADASAERGKGTVTLDVAVKKFAVSGRQIVGRGQLTARLTDDSGASQTARRGARCGSWWRRSAGPAGSLP